MTIVLKKNYRSFYLYARIPFVQACMGEWRTVKMELSIQQWGQIIMVAMIAVALGMDAFSAGLGIGIQKITYKRIISISLLIGFLHALMPLIGMILGQLLCAFMKEITVMIGGAMLCLLGGSMLVGLLYKQSSGRRFRIDSLIATLILSFSVSLDSLSAGLSLGLFHADKWLAITLFGSIGAAMACIGSLIGRSMGHWLGGYGEALGGIILVLVGSRFLW